jgi:hypothetical protein
MNEPLAAEASEGGTSRTFAVEVLGIAIVPELERSKHLILAAKERY